MKAVRFARFGAGHEVAEVLDVPDPGPPGPGEVLVDVEAFPVNPADLLMLSGHYGRLPPLPATPGAEGLGRVVAAGAGVGQLRAGDRVLLLGRENWVQRKRVPAAEAVRIDVDADPLQLAMLKVNPATAMLLLTRFRTIAPGGWLIQDAANSGVGACLIALAASAGVRTLNVVRDERRIAPLAARGADAVLVDGPDLAARVRARLDGAPLALAIDAVAGDATGRLAECVDEGGVVVCYGRMSGRPCAVEPQHFIFRRITLTGFWLSHGLASMTPAGRAALYADLAARVAGGEIRVDVEAVYPIERIRDALAHAARSGRDGKILVAPNGPPG